MNRSCVVVMLFAIACGKKPGGDDRPAGSAGSGSAASADKAAGSAVAGKAGSADVAGKPPAGSAPAWKLETPPLELSCGPRPLAIPAASAPSDASERPLPRAEAIAVCRDLPSVDEVCQCLAGAVEKWGIKVGLSAPASCAPGQQAHPSARLVEVRSKPADPDSLAAGSAFVLVAAHGAKWSAVNIVEAAPDVDLTETPKATHGASIDKIEAKPRADATLIWIQGRNQASETDMGEQDVEGAAALTICIVPTAADQAPYCHTPIRLGVWEYTFTIAKAESGNACQVRNAAVLSASLDSSGALAVRLERGADKTGTAGRYRL